MKIPQSFWSETAPRLTDVSLAALLYGLHRSGVDLPVGVLRTGEAWNDTRFAWAADQVAAEIAAAPGVAVDPNARLAVVWEVAVAEQQLFRLPEALSFDEGASLGINFQTALFALKLRAQTAPGEVVGVLGAAGGVGTASILVAKAMGAKVIAIVHRTGAEDMLRELGADEVILIPQDRIALLRTP